MRVDQQWNRLPRPGDGLSIPRGTQSLTGRDSVQPFVIGHALSSG